MSTGMPELGSKISLISKADIRYEGRLFTVDPQECTIALASVRSFGTEDRETQFPVAPQNQVYDYILFRGSDIKDIRVVNNVSTLPNDPAIMQLSVPPSLGQQQYQPQGFSHPVLGPMGPQIGQNYNPYGALGNMGGLPTALAPGMNINRDMRNMSKQPSSELLNNVLSGPLPQPDISVTNQSRPSDNGSVLELLGGGGGGGGSRSTTPVSLISRKSPTMDAGVQAGGGQGGGGDRKPQQKPIQPPGHRSEQRGGGPKEQDLGHRGPGFQHHRHQHQGPHQGHPGLQGAQHPQQQHQQQQKRGGWNNRPNNMRQRGNRGRGGPYRPQQAGHPGQQGLQGVGPVGPPNKPKNTLKFDNDYDFEQANTEFEAVRSQLGKVKLDGGPGPGGAEPHQGGGTGGTKPQQLLPEMNGDADKKDDSGNETGAGEQEQEEDQEVYYDKSKSFFDNISCEAVERSKGRSQRTDWRTERKLNSETFGVSATRRGGFRGRGGYYRGGMYRGGYRGTGYHRGQSGPRQGTGHRQSSGSSQQQQQQQSTTTSSQSSAPPGQQPPPLAAPLPLSAQTSAPAPLAAAAQ